MAATCNGLVMAQVRRWLSGAPPQADAALVRRFAAERDDVAFAALVDRHGPMVLGVAQRVLGDHHTAEDVFQATFLALARRIGRLRRPAALAAWLHQTAYNIALMALRTQRRRARAEAEAVCRPSNTPLDDISSRELLTILDEELGRLPEAFRLPLVLCCLEGRWHDEAAQLLGWTPGSVKGRLERGRRQLRDRLARRGLTFAVGAGVPLLLARPAVAGLLRQAVLQTARGGASASAAVAALANGAKQPLVGGGWQALLVFAAIGLGALGTGIAFFQAFNDPRAVVTMAQANDLAGAPEPEAEKHLVNAVVLPDGDKPGEPLPSGAVMRFGSSRLRVGAAAFTLSADGREIISVSAEGIVRKFDANTGRFLQRRQLGDRTDVIPMGSCNACLSADGAVAAIDDWTGAGYRRVTVWDVQSGKRIFQRAPGERLTINSYALAPDGKQLAVAEGVSGPKTMHTLRVFDLATGRGEQVGDLGMTMFNECGIRFTPDGKRVVVSQDGGERTASATFTCFSVPDQKLLWRFPRKGKEWGHIGEQWAISPDGKTLVSAAFAGEPGFQIVDIDPVSARPSERFRPDKQVQGNVSFAIAADNRTVVVHHVSRIVLWDLKTRKELKRFPTKLFGIVRAPSATALSADGRALITNQGHIQRWDLGSGKPLFQTPPDDGVTGAIEQLAFTGDGKEMFAGGDFAARFDVATGKRLKATYTTHGAVVSTRGGLRLVHTHITTRPDEIRVTEPGTWKPLHTIFWDEPQGAERSNPESFALARSGRTLLVAHVAGSNSYVTACDAASGRRLSRFAVAGTFFHVRPPFSPCGRWAVLGGKLYHIGTGTQLFTPAGEAGEGLVQGRWAESPVWFSDDGRLLAGVLSRKDREPATTGTLGVWELATGKLLARFPRGKLIGQVAFAPDGRTLAMSDAEGIFIEDMLTAKRLAHYPAPDVTNHTTHIYPCTQSLAFAPDGRTLATGHRDGSILLWKVPQPAEDGPQAVTDSERDALWTDLGRDSPARARAAVDRLARRPAAAVALLKRKFRPAPSPPEPVAQLIRDLNSDVFARREDADRKLRAAGARAEAALRRELAGKVPLETKRRIERILDAMAHELMRLPLSGPTLQGVRAIELLERSGAAEAGMRLQAWAEQKRDPRLAAEAAAAQERTGYR